eukprot:gene17864-19645_t
MNRNYKDKIIGDSEDDFFYSSHLTPKTHQKIVKLIGKKCFMEYTKISDVSNILGVSQTLDFKTANGSDLPYVGFVEFVFALPGDCTDNIQIPFLVTESDIDIVIVGFNVVEELETKHRSPSESFVAPLVSPLNQVKADKPTLFMFEHNDVETWPEGLQLHDKVVTVKPTNSRIDIPVRNTTSQDITIQGRTVLGRVEQVRSVTMVDVTRKNLPTPQLVADDISVKVSPVSSECEENSAVMNEANLQRLTEDQKDIVLKMLHNVSSLYVSEKGWSVETMRRLPRFKEKDDSRQTPVATNTTKSGKSRPSFEDHIKHLRTVLQRLNKHGAKLKARKFKFFKREVCYLGHIVSPQGCKPDLSNIKAITSLSDKPPKNIGELRKLSGLLGYYRIYTRFCQDSETIS